MTEHERGTDRLGRRAKRFLTPLQKYEIWLQLVRGETTISEVADRFEVDRSTIMRLGTIAKDGALKALARLQARCAASQARSGAGGGAGGGGPAGRGAQGAGRQAAAGEGKRAFGAEWPGPTEGGCGHQVR